MSYRFSPVIPAHVRNSMPNRDQDDAKPHIVLRHKCPPITKHTYSRSMSAAGILFFLTAAGSTFATMRYFAVMDPAEAKEQAFSIYALFGAVLAAAGICLLHNVSEGKSKIAGRVIFCLVGGVVGPFFLEWLYPPITQKVSDLRLQLAMGVSFGSLGYIFSRAFVERIFKEAPRVADRHVGDLARKFTPPEPPKDEA
jgi:hypothetical protein